VKVCSGWNCISVEHKISKMSYYFFGRVGNGLDGEYVYLFLPELHDPYKVSLLEN
jgi:hypothetical protein